jgi:hypothetical protein
MKNKGYYGWIHSLNEAAMQSQQNGIDMLAEQVARKGEMLTEAKKPNRTAESIAQQKEYLKNYSITRAAKKKAADEAQAAVIASNPTGIDDQSDLKVDGLHDTAAIIKAEGMKIGSGVQRPETGYHQGRSTDEVETGGTDEINLTSDDDSETGEHAGTEELPYGKLPAESEIGRLARAETARLSVPAGNANAVALDARDGRMHGPLDAPPPTRVHPEPWYKSFGEADWAGAKLNGYQDKSDAQLEDEELRRKTMPDRGSVRESVSQKISRMLKN